MKKFTYGSVCSGIEAATVAWKDFAKCVWLSEVDSFPCAVLAHHYPEVPNLGDMTKIKGKILNREIEAPDILVGGTPCQAFSLMGSRKSLGDERGQLTLAFVELANAIDEIRIQDGKEPVIILWENVPAVINTTDNAFGCFLGGLAKADCELQPPRKKWGRFGYIGGGREVAWKVLDSQYFGVPQRRKRIFVVASSRKDTAPKILFDKIECPEPCKKGGKVGKNVITNTDQKSNRKTSEGLTIHCMTGWGSAFKETYPYPTLCTKGWGDLPLVESEEWVRYLSPIECERLQGFPDDYTKIPFNGKSADECKDSPRYKAIGNSMTVNVMRYLGERICKFI